MPASSCLLAGLSGLIGREQRSVLLELVLMLLSAPVLLSAAALLRRAKRRGGSGAPSCKQLRVHRSLLSAFIAHYTVRSGRIAAWPAASCLSDRPGPAAQALAACAEFADTGTYCAIFSWFLAEAVYLHLNTLARACPGRVFPYTAGNAAQILGWGSPCVITVLYFASHLLPAGDQPPHWLIVSKEPSSLYSYAVRIPAGCMLLCSLALSAWSLRICLVRAATRRPLAHGRLRQALALAKAAGSLCLLVGCLLVFELFPDDLMPNRDAALTARCVQIVLMSLQGVLITVPLCWANRRLAGLLWPRRRRRWHRRPLRRFQGLRGCGSSCF